MTNGYDDLADTYGLYMVFTIAIGLFSVVQASLFSNFWLAKSIFLPACYGFLAFTILVLPIEIHHSRKKQFRWLGEEWAERNE